MNYPNASSSSKEPHLETVRVHFDHLLVAVDLSPSSANTIKIATELAQRSAATLVAVHVLNPDLMLPNRNRSERKRNAQRLAGTVHKKGNALCYRSGRGKRG